MNFTAPRTSNPIKSEIVFTYCSRVSTVVTNGAPQLPGGLTGVTGVGEVGMPGVLGMPELGGLELPDDMPIGPPSPIEPVQLAIAGKASALSSTRAPWRPLANRLVAAILENPAS